MQNHRKNPQPRGQQPEYIPSPRRIQIECSLIQAEWTEEKRERRIVDRSHRRNSWTVPQVATPLGITTKLPVGSN